MIYRFDRNELIYKKDYKRVKYAILALLVVILLSFLAGRYSGLNNLTAFEKEFIILNLKQERVKFTEEKLVNLLTDLNVKFPHIVLAQAKLETGNFKSTIFKRNNNLFGMKEARARVKTAKGTNLNHAYYDSWQESVYDYAFFQSRYMASVKTEEEYFAALDASYAEASKYSQTLKNIIEKEQLRKLF